MEKHLEMTGRNEEVAIEAALQKLGLDRDDVSVEILERPKSGFLGIGGTPAKVKITYEGPDEPVVAVPASTPAPASRPAPAPKAERNDPAPAKSSAPKAAAPKATLGPKVTTPVSDDDDRAARIVEFLTGLMAHMGATATPKVALGEKDTYEVDLEGENLGALIGRRGETLDAIQQLTNYAVNHGQPGRVRVHVDAERYRAKREESLVQLAARVAEKVIKYRRNVTLEPMNAYERHVIHTALQDHPGVSTYSTGTEPGRRTVVAYGKSEQH